ncbi:zf-HC2 domain-containing protein [Pseudomonas panipatensis]|uniref:Putative zinc-finger domain-containing protein n=1 Tax=Pseudomonas panipatensis TaxID=428992 RepID=A0A1G8MV78_9PSED|nr:zf-HC2 domain-containing protein [Pseudomonas panipatensis]SDI71756.1 hypothetical protein SAMN05216272_11755 [Pseudomonas panipatensis]SMP78017.1 hypothetical protein SAMN06295951_11823 [Pseudomonas panipatensis]
MLTCRDISELGSEIIEDRLQPVNRQAVMLHLQGCPRCAAYIKQLELTSRVLQRLALQDDAIDTQAIIEKLQDAER